MSGQKHEGNIAGLAAHGRPVYRDLLNSMFTIQGGELKNVGRCALLGAIQALESASRGWDRRERAASLSLSSQK